MPAHNTNTEVAWMKAETETVSRDRIRLYTEESSL